MKIAAILITLVLSVTQAMACDICGTQLGGYSFGILSQNPTHFVGVRYGQANFTASIDNLILEDEFSNDKYRTIEIMGRYVIGQKWQVNATLPFSINEMDGNVQSVKVSGIGDPVIIAYYNPINTSYTNFRKVNHSLLIGGGIKLPLGKYEDQDDSQILNRNFQLGSGSVDYLISGIYTVKVKNFGLNMEASYKFNTENKINYRFGNQFSAASKVFYALMTPDFSLLPFVGINYENSKMHKEDGFMQANTGGEVALTSFGMQFFVGKFMLLSSYDIPVYQHYNSDANSSIVSENRFNLGVMYNIASRSKVSL